MSSSRCCTTCGEQKPLAAFEADRRVPSGRGPRCRSCRNRNYKPEYRYRYAERNREKERERARRKSSANTKRRDTKTERARHAARNAVAAGAVVKPTRCEVCGDAPERHRLHAHHEDYDRPLDVRWLCSVCHGREHRHALRASEEGS